MGRHLQRGLVYPLPINHTLGQWHHIGSVHTLQYHIRVVSEDWIGAEAFHTISFSNLVLPQRMPPHTGESVDKILEDGKARGHVIVSEV